MSLEGGVAVKWTDRTGGDASPAGLEVVRFADELFGRIDKLKSPGFDPKWDGANPGKQSARP